jgi:acetoin utilization deacetylase AcuC-like enzyme/formylglycine-generating enzyme required for sulfatase activity
MIKRITKTLRVLCLIWLVLIWAGIMGLGCQKRPDSDVTQTAAQVVKTKSGIEMVSIPAGEFPMGSKAGSADETPAHRVYVSAFLMDRHEVTQEQYGAFPLPDPSHFKDPQRPVEQINWTDALAFCNERSLDEDLQPCYDLESGDCDFEANGYRLPTEAEWEYACRAGTATTYAYGNSAQQLLTGAWCQGNAPNKTQPVAQKPANAWGLFDMHGNVKEWCNDYYSETYYQTSSERDPRGPDQGSERVIRGGGWSSSPEACRASYRASDASINDTCLASDAIGFRCVRKLGAVLPVSEANQTSLQQEPNMPTDAPAPKTGFLYDDIFLRHDTGAGHPEQPARLTAIVKHLEQSASNTQLLMLGPPKPATQQWLATVHTTEYVQRAQNAWEQGMRFLDSMDVPVSQHSYEVATHAAGGLLQAVDAVMQGRITNAFCAVRPPGHHALPDQAMGFCIFNNVAIGTRYVQTHYQLERVLIVDWDVHHGNGTQAIFYDDPTVLYFSTHQYPFYPGTGAASEKGDGAGVGYTLNVPLAQGTNDAVYMRVFQEQLTRAALAFKPDFVFISAGFDAHEHDILGGMKVTTQGFAALTRVVTDIAQQCCAGRIVSVLEGGYHLQGLANSVGAHVNALMEASARS